MPVVIEPLANRHLEGLYAAINAVAGERIYLGRFSLAPFEESAKFFQSLIDRDEAAFVAQADDAVVGWCDIIAIDREPQRHVGVLGMGLVAGHRGKGIGARLLTAALDKAWSKGLTRIELTVYGANKPAIALYDRFGFEREGVKRNFQRIDGLYDDALIMAIVRP